MKLLSTAILAATLAAPAARGQLAAALDLNQRGNVASDAGRYEEAIPLYRQALAIWSAAGPGYEPHRAGTLFNLGIAVSGSGNRKEAVRILEESLAIHRKTLGARNYRTITNINLLAANYLMLGRLEQAAELYQEALPVTRELFPADIQAARALEGMAAVLTGRGKPAEALAPAEEALRIAIQAAGEESPDAALAYSTLAEAHRLAGHSERALPLFRKARAIFEKANGGDHPRVASLLGQEALLLIEDGKLATAEQYLSRANGALDRSCPKCVLERAGLESNLAVLRLRQKRYGDAGQLLTHVIALREGSSSLPGADLAQTFRLLAVVRQKEKRYEEAARLTQRADAILSYR